MKLRTETTQIVNDLGERVEIIVEFYQRYGERKSEYRIRDLKITQKRKRKGEYLSEDIRDRFAYRNLPVCEREAYVKNEFLKHVTEEQLRSAVDALYRSLAPTEENIIYRIG